jgi:arginine decarboxylase
VDLLVPELAPWNGRREKSLTITIAAATATARTELAAFDRALVAVGAENRNLIRLSSVIPASATIVHGPASDGGEWGDRLCVVYAEQRASVPGTEAWAGVGWVQDDCSGAGLFVEHETDAEDKLRDLITRSLAELQVSRGIDFGPSRMITTGIRCAVDPVCALVLASFGSQDWRDVRQHRVADGCLLCHT